MADESIQNEQEETMSRAEFLKDAGMSILLMAVAAGGLGAYSQIVTKLARRGLTTLPGFPGSPWYSMAVDITQCIGCGKCVEACCEENDVPEEHYRTWIERYVIKKDGSVHIDSPDGGKHGFQDDIPDENTAKAFFVPKLCNHCDESPCIQVCPVGATFRSDEGVVLIDYDYCVGCRYCIQACPYGSRFWNPTKNTADKCTLCYHRIKKGLKPACVDACPVGARIFGDISDTESPISKFCRDNAVMALKPQLRTGAKVMYKGLAKGVV